MEPPNNCIFVLLGAHNSCKMTVVSILVPTFFEYLCEYHRGSRVSVLLFKSYF